MVCTLAGMDDAITQVSTSALVDTNPLTTRGPSGRRRWPAELKRRIVDETREPGVSVSIVARRYDVNANQVFRWRQLQELSGSGPWMAREQARLVPVELRSSAPTSTVEGTIEIELPGGVRVRTIGRVDAQLLGRVLDALR